MSDRRWGGMYGVQKMLWSAHDMNEGEGVIYVGYGFVCIILRYVP
jgi:hypothetical protein